MIYVLTALLVFVAVEVALRLPFTDHLRRMLDTTAAVPGVVSSKTLTDDEKQARLLKASGTIFLTTLKLIVMMAAIVGAALVVPLVWDYLRPFERPVLVLLSDWGPIGFSVAFAVVYYYLRQALIGSPKKRTIEEYGTLSRFLHRLALGSRAVAETSFDMERMLHPAEPPAADAQPVFVSGLARAGTTILMRTLYGTGAFRSLTYRDMPFVLMPKLWSKASKFLRQHKAEEERAHGDRIKVNYDSPEAFEEVFWRIFDGPAYMQPDALVPHSPDTETLDRFRHYVAQVAAATNGDPRRYLSKNNNNLLRLPSLKKAFPGSVIIIPFRDPIQHALSLKQQHERFLIRHKEDAFGLTYMTWLGHHEFGGNHKPFRFPDDPPQDGETSPAELAYWVTLWIRSYRYVLAQAPADSLFVSYERLGEDPARVLGAVFERLGMTLPDGAADGISPARPHAVDDLPPALMSEAQAVYDDLTRLSL